MVVLGAGYGGICDKRLVSKWAAAATTKKLRRRKSGGYKFSLSDRGKGRKALVLKRVVVRVFAYHLHSKTVGKHGG